MIQQFTTNQLRTSYLVTELWCIALNGCHCEQDRLLRVVDIIQDNPRTLGIQTFSCQQITKLITRNNKITAC